MAEQSELEKPAASIPNPKVIKHAYDDPNRHDQTDSYKRPENHTDLSNIHTVHDMVAFLEANPTAEIDARVFGVKDGKATPFQLDRKGFLECWKKNENLKTFRENVDWFGRSDTAMGTAGGIGQDYTPMLGGPFSKQLYYSSDYLQMHSQAFFAINHDPILRTGIDIIINFVLGKGFRVDCESSDGLVIWRAFEKANKLQSTIRTMFRELLCYGEDMIWWLPDNNTEIRYMVPPSQASNKGLIPRIRLQDPSSCWEIITFPEDIESKIAFVMIYPTQYQTFSGTADGKPVPSTKFIYQQIPAAQMDHYKLNCMSNEKRGRSVLFPVLGYAKRLRDTVNYQVIGLQKQAAFSIDVSIDGNQTDIDNYYNQIQSQGQFAPPGSEFVHNSKIVRSMIAPTAGKGINGEATESCLDLIAAGLGIPVSYFGVSGKAGSTRAGALVATEPVAKKMEEYQSFLEGILHDMADRLFKMFGINAEIEVTFPEIITQDRSSKLKDLSTAESMGWISHSRAAEIASKELNISNFDWDIEKEAIEEERIASDAQSYMPLTMPAAMPLPGAPGTSQLAQPAKPATAIPTNPNMGAQPAPIAPGPGQSPQTAAKNDSLSAVTSDEKRDIKNAART